MRVQIDSTSLAAATPTKCPEAKTRLIRRKLLRSMTKVLFFQQTLEVFIEPEPR